jgi:hypothetical protein
MSRSNHGLFFVVDWKFAYVIFLMKLSDDLNLFLIKMTQLLSTRWYFKFFFYKYSLFFYITTNTCICVQSTIYPQERCVYSMCFIAIPFCCYNFAPLDDEKEKWKKEEEKKREGGEGGDNDDNDYDDDEEKSIIFYRSAWRRRSARRMAKNPIVQFFPTILPHFCRIGEECEWQRVE